MKTETWIYIWWLADNIRQPAIIFATLGTACSCFFVWMTIVARHKLNKIKAERDYAKSAENFYSPKEKEELSVLLVKAECDLKSAKRILRTTISISMIGIIPALFLPSSNYVAAIAVTPKVVESQVVTKDIPELYRAEMDAALEKFRGKQDGDR